jgi:hypothetical protein
MALRRESSKRDQQALVNACKPQRKARSGKEGFRDANLERRLKSRAAPGRLTQRASKPYLTL